MCKLAAIEVIRERDPADGWGCVLLPDTLDRKYPNAPKKWRRQWVFPQENRWKNTQTGEEGRQEPRGRFIVGEKGVLCRDVAAQRCYEETV